MTKDGRDQSLDYKLSGFLVPKGSEDAQIIDQLAPGENDILIPKTSCSVFNSTNIEYVLRNLGENYSVIKKKREFQSISYRKHDALLVSQIKP